MAISTLELERQQIINMQNNSTSQFLQSDYKWPDCSQNNCEQQIGYEIITGENVCLTEMKSYTK